jgi:hypothetical protein
MKTPFPGMDPYLEHPALWPSVHRRMIVWLAHQLRPLIRPRYVASVEEYVYIEGPAQLRIPDIWVQRASRHTSRRGRVATARKAAGPIVVDVTDLEVSQTYIEVLDRYQDLRIVTVIELVSPSNKVAGPGQEAYLLKQQQVRATEAHLVEIDLLRFGAHILSVPEFHARMSQPYQYLISVNRWPKRNRFELYPAQLREPLPILSLPLSEPDPDVPLNLQIALEQVYEDADYMLRVRYQEPCIPPLEPADQKWADERWAAFLAKHPELAPAPRPRAKGKSTNGRRGKAP